MLTSERFSQVTNETWKLLEANLTADLWVRADVDHFLERYKGPPLEKAKLCQRCSDLHFEDKIDGRPFDVPTRSLFVADMAAIDFSCALCQFLQRLTPGYNHHILCERPEGTREEITFSSSVVPDLNPVDLSSPRDASRWLEFSAYRDIPTEKTKGDQNWPNDPEIVNLGALKAKYELCKAEHGAVCGVRKLPPVKGLQLINCETMKREAATANMEYVALSYVWGPAQQRIYLDDKAMSEQLLPRTIRDAASLTLQLGFKHLWVDQVCINQQGAHKMEQIRQMHRIYRNAEITIIAAAGSHSDYGIPGSPGTPRLPQILFRIGNRLFIEKKIDPVCRIKYTPWIHRGWTLQEEVMSTRTIFFTDREAWFSCACMAPIHGREYTDAEYRPHFKNPLAFRRKERAAKTLLTPLCTVSIDMGRYNGTLEYITLVEDYSDRDLTVTNDVINAFSGILEMFEQSNPPVYHIWGSPILPPHHLIWDSHEGSGEYRVSNPQSPSLEGFLRGLCFQRHNDRTGSGLLARRPGFPSWSWAGWIGRIHFRYLHAEDDGKHPDTGISIVVERTDGTILSWAEFEKLAYLKKYPETISRFIHISAWTMAVKLKNRKSRDDRSKFCLYQVIQTSNGREYNKVEFMNQKSDDPDIEELQLLSTKTYAAILVSDIERLFNRQRRVYFMLVEIKTDHVERVGILQLSWHFQYWASENIQLLDTDILSEKGIDIDGLKLQWKETRLG